MNEPFNTENLEIGDKVIVNISSYGRVTQYVGEICKKTPTGLIDVTYNGNPYVRFKQDGTQAARRNRYSFTRMYLGYYSKEKGLTIQKKNLMEQMTYDVSHTDFNQLPEDIILMVYTAINGNDNELVKEYRKLL